MKSMFYRFCKGKYCEWFAPHKMIPDPKDKNKLISCLDLYKRKLKKGCTILDYNGKEIS